MILKVFLEDQLYPVDIPDYIVEEAEDFFRMVDHDMDAGWQMSHVWVENPDSYQRCLIVADKLLTALQNDEQEIGVMLAGYILNRRPGTTELHLATSGNMHEHELH